MLQSVRAALLLLLACTSQAFAGETLMAPANQEPKPEAGKALVVFMRPSFYGGGIASSVYEAPDGEDRFLGVLRAKEKLAYQVDPGAHRFMVVGENADFLDANVEAGKTYYVLISPRPGVWKARFSLLPLHNDQSEDYSINTADFREWVAKTHYIELNPAAEAWYAENKASVDEKKADYLQKWNRMAPADRAELTLRTEDGVAAP